MDLFVDMARAAGAALLGMSVMWPLLRKTAVTPEERKRRWKQLWLAALICWTLAVVMFFFVGKLRDRVEESDPKAQAAMERHEREMAVFERHLHDQAQRIDQLAQESNQ